MSSSDSSPRPPRLVLAKPGMDGHNRGINVVRAALMKAGCEIIYLGIRRSAEEIAGVAVDEDAHIVGLSLLSGAHIALTGQVLRALEERDASSISVIVGGIIPSEDHQELYDMGVAAIFTPGATTSQIKAKVDQIAAETSVNH